MIKKNIVKFLKRKLQIKKEIKNINPSEFDFAKGTTIFIKESLRFCYKMLWSKCKKLWEKQIHTYFTSNGNI